jgi:hypothetical protein
MTDGPATWNSLEVTKLAVSVMTPVAVVVLGILVQRATARIERAQWANQKVIEYRLQVFERVAPKLNRLLCFYTFVGPWKELSPPDVLRLKRELDEDVHVNRILFSPEFFDAYLRFMALLFQMFATPGRDALIRAFVQTELGDRRLLGWWDPDHEAWFARDGIPSLTEVRTAYEGLVEHFRVELYIPTAAGNPA